MIRETQGCGLLWERLVVKLAGCGVLSLVIPCVTPEAFAQGLGAVVHPVIGWVRAGRWTHFPVYAKTPSVPVFVRVQGPS